MLNLVEPVAIHNSLSCISQDYAGYVSSGRFDPKLTVLSKFSLIIPGMGLKPSYCDRPIGSSVKKKTGDMHVTFTRCRLMECPHCSDLWRLQQVFNSTVRQEAYAEYSGTRPCKGNFSVSPDQDFTLDDLRHIRTNGTDRLTRQGVIAGETKLHGLRIKKCFKRTLRRLTGGSSSAAHWSFILKEDSVIEFN